MSEKPVFTEGEMRTMGHAMLCLKSGLPEIDYQKLADYLGMSNPKSASNAWATIKKKITAANEDGGAIVPASIPKRGKKKAAAKDDDDKDESASEGKNTKKSSPKKRATKGEDGEGSAKKKGRKAKDEAVDSGVEDAVDAMRQEHGEGSQTEMAQDLL